VFLNAPSSGTIASGERMIALDFKLIAPNNCVIAPNRNMAAKAGILLQLTFIAPNPLLIERMLGRITELSVYFSIAMIADKQEK
jgi:hypothetical protein